MKILQIGRGAMGQILAELLSKDEKNQLTALSVSENLPDEAFDVIIDFSHPDNLAGILAYLEKYPTPLVMATTGFSSAQTEQINQLSSQMPVLFSGNFSIGVILMNRLAKEMARVLAADFDIELIEKHHNKKIDAPSGTAKMLLDSVNEGLDYSLVYGRSGVQPRNAKEIGVHSVRAGSIVGEHELLFAGNDEILSIKHEAHSKTIFAKGAIAGMNWLVKQNAGLYNMEDVLFPN